MHAVGSLDGRDTDTVSLNLGNGDSMDIGGGADGMYKCHARTMSSFYDLLNPLVQQDMSDTMDVQMNDESNTFPRCTIVSLDMAKSAVECFCVNGDLHAQLHWDNSLEYEPL